MFIPARSDNAVRAAVALARAWPELLKAADLSNGEGLPLQFLENILGDLRKGGLVRTRRGYRGGYRLSRAPDEIHLAEILGAIGSPLMDSTISDSAPQGPIGELWTDLSRAIRVLLEERTLADLLAAEARHRGAANSTARRRTRRPRV